MPISEKQRRTEAVTGMLYRKFDRFYEEYHRERNMNAAKRRSGVKSATLTLIPNRMVYELLQQNYKSVYEIAKQYAISKTEIIAVKAKQDRLLGDARKVGAPEELKVMRFLMSMWSEAYALLTPK